MDQNSLNDTLEIIRITHSLSVEANGIHPGTVKGIAIYLPPREKIDSAQLKLVLNLLHSITVVDGKADGLLFGTMQFCPIILQTEDPAINLTVLQMMQLSDFVICYDYTSDIIKNLGAKTSLQYLAANWDVARDVARRLNHKLKFSARSQWLYSGQHHMDNPIEFKIFWQEANGWATKNGILFFMDEAFDIPIRNEIESDIKVGWWKLKQNELIDSVEGYKENVVAGN